MPDVAIAGGGIIGAACAMELATRGMSVTLVERSELAAGASGRNHGLLLVPPDPALVPMFRSSLEKYHTIGTGSAVPLNLDADPIGFLITASDDEAEIKAARAEADAVAASGVAVEELDRLGLSRVEPGLGPAMTSGWLLEDGRRVDPAALTVSLALRAREAGADVRTHLPVRGLLTQGDRVTGLATDQGPILADSVIVAAGPWAPSLLRRAGVRLPIIGARGWLVHLAPATPALGQIVERGGWHTLAGQDVWRPLSAGQLAEGPPPNDVGSILQPNRDGTVLVGGSMQHTVAAEPGDHAVAGELVRRAVEIVPALAEAEVLAAWWGTRPLTPDGRPFIGWAAEGLFVAVGHGSQGVILAGGTADLVGSLVSREEPHLDPVPFRPDRFAA